MCVYFAVVKLPTLPISFIVRLLEDISTNIRLKQTLSPQYVSLLGCCPKTRTSKAYAQKMSDDRIKPASVAGKSLAA